MAIVKQSVPYEYLVRFNADGTVRGQHIKYLERVYDEDTGEVYAERETDAKSVGDENARVLLDTALNEVAAASAVAIEKEREEKQRIEQELETVKSEKRELERQLNEKVITDVPVDTVRPSR